MRKRTLIGLALAGALAASTSAMAQNIIRMNAPIAQGDFWEETQASVSAWIAAGDVYGCSSWSPAVDTVAYGQSFTQGASDCLQPQQRTVQPREIHTKTLALRNAGEATIEKTINPANSTRTAVGTLIVWQQGYTRETEWVNASNPADSNYCGWSPDPSTVTQGTSFTQTGNCRYEQIRTVQPQERNPVTGSLRDTGTAYTQSRSMVTTLTRTAVGTQVVTVKGLPASEGGSFTLSAAATVYYGVKGTTRLTSKAFAAGSYSCSNSVFGDPASGTVKTCWIP